MAQIDKNTVPAKAQTGEGTPVYYINGEGGGKRVLFAGNSITLHGYKPDIGWYGENYGMAASKRENDYVHLVMSEITKTDADAAFCICQVAEWERNWKNGSKELPSFEKAREFNADIVIMRMVENCPRDGYDEESFMREYLRLAEFLKPDPDAKIIITTGFWQHVADDAIIKAAKTLGCEAIYLGDLGEDDSMKALDEFEHSGVANHPGDKGMAAIAERICSVL